MAMKLMLGIVVLVAVQATLGAAATIAVALLFGIIAHGRLMVWEAARRNNAERAEFQAVNSGQKEPDPLFLYNIWKL